MIYKEFSLEPTHEFVKELDLMREWIKSIPKCISGRSDRNDLSEAQLQKRKDGIANNAWMYRFDHLKSFDHSKIKSIAERVYEEQVGVFRYLTVPVAKTWYPKGGYLGWHIDNDGGRIYSAWAEGKSYFRYQHPVTKEIITSWDKPKEWSFRIFTFDAKNPLWHCVGAEDMRISVGYRFVHHG